jgi:hypothetical protein
LPTFMPRVSRVKEEPTTLANITAPKVAGTATTVCRAGKGRCDAPEGGHAQGHMHSSNGSFWVPGWVLLLAGGRVLGAGCMWAAAAGGRGCAHGLTQVWLQCGRLCGTLLEECKQPCRTHSLADKCGRHRSARHGRPVRCCCLRAPDLRSTATAGYRLRPARVDSQLTL